MLVRPVNRENLSPIRGMPGSFNPGSEPKIRLKHPLLYALQRDGNQALASCLETGSMIPDGRSSPALQSAKLQQFAVGIHRASASIVVPPARPNLGNALDSSPSATEPDVKVLVFHSELVRKIFGSDTRGARLFELRQDRVSQRSAPRSQKRFRRFHWNNPADAGQLQLACRARCSVRASRRFRRNMS